MDHSTAAEDKEATKAFSIGSHLDKIIENLDNPLGLINRDYCVQVAMNQIIKDSKQETVNCFMAIGNRLLQAGVSSNYESELTVLMYLAIAQDLKEKALPGANYYYELAYICHPIKDETLNPYALLYARSLDMLSPHSHLEMQRIIALYSKISMVQFPMDAALAEVKLALLNNQTFANIKLALDSLLIKYPPLTSSITAEKTWADLCDYAKNFRSDNPSIQALLDYLRQETLLNYPSLKQDQLEEATKLTTEDDARKLLALLELAKKSRNTNPPITDIINSDKTAEALRIYYGPITEENVNCPKAALNLVQSLRKNNCDSFYYFYQNYDALSKNSSMIQFYREFSSQAKPPIYFLEMAAWNGNREAQYELSKYYLAQHLERGTEDISLKEKWLYFLALAANNNITESQYDLAIAIRSKEIPAQYNAELSYLASASLSGHQKASEECSQLQKYIEKINLSKISREDFKLLSDTVDIFIFAAIRFAYCLENGFGATQDLEEAYKIYETLSLIDPVARFRFIATKSKSTSRIQEPDPFFELSDPTLSKKIIFYLLAIQQNKAMGPQEKYILASELRQLMIELTDNPTTPLEEAPKELSTATELAQALIDQYAPEATMLEDKNPSQPKLGRREIIKRALAKLGEKLEDPLGFVNHDEHSRILILELLETESPSALLLLSNYLAIAKEYIKIQTDDPLNYGALAKAQKIMNSFLYYIIHQSSPDLDYYAELAYKCSSAQNGWNLGMTYNYARFLEKSSQNSREKKHEALNLYKSIVATGEVVSNSSHSVTGITKIKLAILEGTTFVEIISSLKAIQKEYPELISNVTAEISWINLYNFAKNFKAPHDSKMQGFLDHVNQVIAQEFPSLSPELFESVQNKELLNTKNKDKLLALFNGAIASRGQFTSDITNNNITYKDRSSEFAKIIDDDALQPVSYLRSLINKDPDALYYFYLNYDHCTSPKSESFYSNINLKLYQGFTKKPKEQFLREAALAGNSVAQYDLAEQSLKEAKELKQAVLSEQNPDELVQQNKKLETLKARFTYFLELAAGNNHREAVLKIADCLALNDDPVNHDKLDRITLDPVLVFLYYKKASEAGHAIARTRYEQGLSRITSLNLREISPDDFAFLQNISHYDNTVMMIYAICLEGGFGIKQDSPRACKIYKYLSPYQELARFKIAISELLATNNPKSLIAILQNTTENPNALSCLAASIENETLSPEIKYIMACELNKLSFTKKQKRAANDLRKGLLQNAASKGFVAAQIELVKILILQPTQQDEAILTSKQEAFAIISDIINGDNSDKLKTEAAGQMLTLLETKDLLPENLTIEKIKPFLVPDFLTSQEAKKIPSTKILESKIQFKLAGQIDKLVQKIAEPDKSIWHQKALDLTILSARAPKLYTPAQEKIILYFINGSYNLNLETIKEFKKWIKLSNITNALEIATRLYEIGKELLEEVALKQYKQEFDFYFKLTKDKLTTEQEKLALEQKYPDWIKQKIVEKITAPPSAAASKITAPVTPLAEKTLSAIAHPFLTKEPAPLKEKPSRQQEMKSFLKERRRISSIHDLPLFLQEILGKMPQGSKFWIKGSVISSRRIERTPVDLDIAFEINEMSSWSQTEIKEFVKNNFGIDKVEIYNKDGVFTVNAKDSAIDISFYSNNKKPPSYLDWATNRDILLRFREDGTSYIEYTTGFQEYLLVNPQLALMNSNEALLINPNARGLMLRLCFLAAISEIAPEEIILAIGAILPNHPADLLFKEFKLDRCNPAEHKAVIREKITQFVDGHQLNPDQTRNLTFHINQIIYLDWSFITKQHRLTNPVHPSTFVYYQEMYKTINNLAIELSTTQAAATTPDSSIIPTDKTTLSPKSQNKKGESH